jgi:hypothetical protein
MRKLSDLEALGAGPACPTGSVDRRAADSVDHRHYRDGEKPRSCTRCSKRWQRAPDEGFSIFEELPEAQGLPSNVRRMVSCPAAMREGAYVPIFSHSRVAIDDIRDGISFRAVQVWNGIRGGIGTMCVRHGAVSSASRDDPTVRAADVTTARLLAELCRQRRKRSSLRTRELKRMLRAEGIPSVRECSLLSALMKRQLVCGGGNMSIPAGWKLDQLVAEARNFRLTEKAFSMLRRIAGESRAAEEGS